MKRNIILTFSSLFVLLTLTYYAQEKSDYVEDEILIKVEVPFNKNIKSNGLVKTEIDWFNIYSKKYKCVELEPIFKNETGELGKFYKIKFAEKEKIDKFIDEMNNEKM